MSASRFASVIVAYIAVSLVFFSVAVTRANHIIEDIKTIFRYYPKHYCKVPRLIRRLFRLKRKEAPIFMLVYMLVFALGLATPLFGFIALCIFGEKAVLYVYRTLLIVEGLATVVCVLIIYPIFKRGDKKKRKNIR